MSAATVVPKARPAARRATTTSRAARPAPNRTAVRPLRRAQPTTRPRRHLRVVDTEAVRRTRRVRVSLWLLAVVGTGSLLAVVAFHVLLAQGQLELDRVEQKIRAEQELYPKKRVEVAGLSSPEAIMSRALAMGMVEAAGVPTVVTVAPDPAAPAPTNATSTTHDYEQVKRHLDPSA